MDPFSHALLGGVAVVSKCRNAHKLRLAAICGAVAAMAPDLDIFIRAAGNPMLGLGFHRHFTHALAFVPFGALIVAIALWPFLRRKMDFAPVYGFCFLGYLTHGLLDAMTNYGTHLFWPFTERRESWSIISIIDPIFTITMLVLLGIAVWKRARNTAHIAAIFALTYWSLGYYQREQATAAMHELAAKRQHRVERFEVKPSFGNLFAWRGQYLHEGMIQIDAYHVSPWRGRLTYEGGALPLYEVKNNNSPVQQKDLHYFTFFSDGWVAFAPNHPELISDVRFAMLPNQTTPIWGIRLQPQLPESHVLFENIRTRKAGDVDLLWTMIKGEQLSESQKQF